MKNLNKHSKLPAASYKVILDIYCHHSTLQDLIKIAYDKPYKHYKHTDVANPKDYPHSYVIIFEYAQELDQILLTRMKEEIDEYKANLKELDSTFIRHLTKIEAEFMRSVVKLQETIYNHTN